MKKSRYLQPDGTAKTSSTPRIEGTMLYFTSSGDDSVNGVVGDGTPLVLNNTVTPTTQKSVDCQFIDDIHLKDGMIIWENAILGDTLDWEVILPANTPLPTGDGKGNANMVEGTVQYITAASAPDDTWVGDYFLFPTDYVVDRFVNNLLVLGTNHHGMILESNDAMLVPKIFKMRLNYRNIYGEVNPNFVLVATIEMYRDRTV